MLSGRANRPDVSRGAIILFASIPLTWLVVGLTVYSDYRQMTATGSDFPSTTVTPPEDANRNLLIRSIVSSCFVATLPAVALLIGFALRPWGLRGILLAAGWQFALECVYGIAVSGWPPTHWEFMHAWWVILILGSERTPLSRRSRVLAACGAVIVFPYLWWCGLYLYESSGELGVSFLLTTPWKDAWRSLVPIIAIFAAWAASTPSLPEMKRVLRSGVFGAESSPGEEPATKG